MRRQFSTKTGWAMALSVFALVAGTLVPWCRGTYLRFELHRDWPYVHGFQFLLGPEALAWAIVVALFVVICFLVATQPLAPAPLWRSLALALAGAAVMGLSFYAMHRLDASGIAEVLHAGPFLLAGAGAGLVLIAALEVRDTLAAARPDELGLWRGLDLDTEPPVTRHTADPTAITRPDGGR